MKILITGSSGFIGKNLIIKLLNETLYTLYCLDIYPNELINNYKNNNNIIFINENILTTNIISIIKPEYIIHLAALSGVRDSKENPTEYMNVNITGFTHIFEQARLNNIKKIIYASSSSVYGDMLDVSSSLSENDVIGPAKSIYSLTKHMNEQIAKFYYDNYNINSIGLRFFTVYGPYGRSNMAISKFTESILNNNEITVYGDGEQIRDFTHVNDIINGIVLALQSNIKYDIFNIGTENTISINNLIKLIEKITNKQAQIKYLPRNDSDV